MIPPALTPPALPSLNPLDSAVSKIHSRWPDVVPAMPERDRERLAQLIQQRVAGGQWEGTPLSLVTRAARVVFEAEFRERDDLARVRQFYYDETRCSTRPALLGVMLSVYLATYEPGAAHTTALADALAAARERLSPKRRTLLDNLPQLLDPRRAHEDLGRLMRDLEHPWNALRAFGLQSPHAPGLMDHAHLVYLREIGPRLNEPRWVETLLSWLRPDGQDARTSGAAEAIEALLNPWRHSAPSESLQSRLVQGLVSLYRDPRTTRAFPWSSVSPPLMAIMMRWLTGENIRFFLDVVSEVEESHMWAPRRAFWLGLHEKKMIDEAWVAFSPVAERKARELRARADNRASLAFGRQEARGGRIHTSLLVLRIGNCIVVEGSHSYKVHVFSASNERAPKLFLSRYNCEDIRHIPGARTETHNGSWEQRVSMLIGYRS
jgi:hypothetical protein